jgi:hypothetical protein
VANIISSSDAFSLFDHWSSQRRFISLQVYGSSGQRIFLDALILDVLSKSERLVLLTKASNGVEAQLGISFSGAEFTSADTRESPDPELASALFDSFLLVGWTGTTAMIFCIREHCAEPHSYIMTERS